MIIFTANHTAYRIFISCLFILLIGQSDAQIIQSVRDTITTEEEQVGVFPKSPNAELYNFKVGGFYRFFSTGTTFANPYPLYPDGTQSDQRIIFIGDDAQLPNLQLNVSGRPHPKASWGFDLFAFQLLNGLIGTTYGSQVTDSLRPSLLEPLAGARLGSALNLQLGLNLYGSYASEYGNFDIKVGGIHWVSLSELTLATTQAYNRFTLFERNPWDPLDANLRDRYENYYAYGNINQEARWGEQAFSGVIIDGTDLPSNVSFRVLYGKTALDGGFFAIPNLSYGGRVRKNFTSGGFVGINTFNNATFADSTNQLAVGFNVVTAEFQKSFSQLVAAHAEIGIGRYINAGNTLDWGEAIDIQLRTKEALTRFPITLRMYRISPNVVNNNAIFNNTSVQQAVRQTRPNQGIDPNSLQPFASAIVNMGNMTNNRQAMELNVEKELGDLSLSGGISYGAEIEANVNAISFGHAVNALTRSRFWRWNFPANVGPYSRYNVIYRGTYELTDVYDGLNLSTRQRALSKKYFNNIELQARYKTQLFNRSLYAFYLGNLATAQDFMAAFIPFSDLAYIRNMNNEVELYYEMNSKWMLCLYLGLERTIGNAFTDVSPETKKPRDQVGRGIGIGTDLTLSKNAGLFVRHRWAFFEDRNFLLDQFTIQETMVELNISF